jgi:hypothetical protein
MCRFLQQISSKNSPFGLTPLWRTGMIRFNRPPRTQPRRHLQKHITHRQLLAYSGAAIPRT